MHNIILILFFTISSFLYAQHTRFGIGNRIHPIYGSHSEFQVSNICNPYFELQFLTEKQDAFQLSEAFAFSLGIGYEHQFINVFNSNGQSIRRNSSYAWSSDILGYFFLSRFRFYYGVGGLLQYVNRESIGNSNNEFDIFLKPSESVFTYAPHFYQKLGLQFHLIRGVHIHSGYQFSRKSAVSIYQTKSKGVSSEQNLNLATRVGGFSIGFSYTPYSPPVETIEFYLPEF